MSLDDTLRRLPPGAAEYSRSLFHYHWLEAAWFYERRETLTMQGALVSPDRWLGIENRGEAHVAALECGGHLVFDHYEARALQGDVGELNVAIRLLARTNRREEFTELVEALDWYEPARAWAIADALAWDAPDGWQELVRTLLADETIPEEALGPLARVIGMRRWPLQESVLEVLERGVGDPPALAWAIGRLEATDALPLLDPLIEERRAPAVRQAAALAAVRFAPDQVLAFLEQVLAAEDWAAIPFALGAGAQGWDTLSTVARASPTPQRMLAVGLLGHGDGIDLLLEQLDHRDCGEAAAEALYLLTGAPLHQETHAGLLEMEPDDDDDDDDDDERPLGVLVSRLPRSATTWSAWLDEHGRGLVESRVRGGASFGPDLTLDELARTTVSAQVREWMIEELAIRYRLPIDAWPRLLQKTQRAALGRARAELDERPKIQRGAWYRSGDPLWRT